MLLGASKCKKFVHPAGARWTVAKNDKATAFVAATATFAAAFIASRCDARTGRD